MPFFFDRWLLVPWLMVVDSCVAWQPHNLLFSVRVRRKVPRCTNGKSDVADGGIVASMHHFCTLPRILICFQDTSFHSRESRQIRRLLAAIRFSSSPKHSNFANAFSFVGRSGMPTPSSSIILLATLLLVDATMAVDHSHDDEPTHPKIKMNGVEELPNQTPIKAIVKS